MKQEVAFVLENSNWPALLVEGAGAIRRANSAAVQLFGPVLAGGSSLLSAIWAPENKIKAEAFLAGLEAAPGPVESLQFRLKTGITESFSSYICPVKRDGQKYYLFQLFKRQSDALDSSFREVPDAPPQRPPGPEPTESAAVRLAEPVPAVEAGLAHKQKLDCALQLARSVALDFNNALTTILGHTSLLLSKIEPDNPWRNSLVEVEKSAEKAAEIACDLAAFSRQEKDVRVQMAGNINVILQRCVDLFRTPELAPLTWDLRLERRLFTVRFDEAKMQQAFVKILENSVQAVARDGGVSVQTRNLELPEPTHDRTAKLNPGNYVCVEISDNGSGITPDLLPRIFEPFFTTKEAGSHRGLGLAFVYGIVTNHGGSVAISSQPGVGTSVRVYLPANKKIVKDTAAATDDLSGTQTVVIVDDEDLLLTMGQMVLSSYGYEVLTANSGQKALELFQHRKTPVDLLITDLVMPNMSGRELIERIQQLSPSTRILCSSGYVRATHSEEQEAYLQKPFTSQDLLRKVKQILTSSPRPTDEA